jgi:hypothetical protein
MSDTSYESRWEKQWSAGLSKHTSFDKGGVSPALQQLLDQGVLPKGRALVPGNVRNALSAIALNVLHYSVDQYL